MNESQSFKSSEIAVINYILYMDHYGSIFPTFFGHPTCQLFFQLHFFCRSFFFNHPAPLVSGLHGARLRQAHSPRPYSVARGAVAAMTAVAAPRVASPGPCHSLQSPRRLQPQEVYEMQHPRRLAFFFFF